MRVGDLRVKKRKKLYRIAPINACIVTTSRKSVGEEGGGGNLVSTIPVRVHSNNMCHSERGGGYNNVSQGFFCFLKLSSSCFCMLTVMFERKI